MRVLFVIFSLAVFAFMVSCEKESTNQTSTNDLKDFRGICGNYSYGLEHNNFMESTYDILENTSDNNLGAQVVYNHLIGELADFYSISENVIGSYLFDSIGFMPASVFTEIYDYEEGMANLLNNNLSKLGNSYIENELKSDLMTFSTDATSQGEDYFLNACDNLISKYSNTPYEEQICVLVDISKASYDYWTNNHAKWNNRVELRDIGPHERACINGDISGAAMGLAGGAITGGPAGALFGVMFGATAGSALGGFRSYMGWKF